MWTATIEIPCCPLAIYGTIEYDYCRGLVYYDTASIWERDKRKGPTYFWNVMCVGKGDVPYLPSDVRKLILGRA